MKKVFNNSEICHVYAQQSQNEGKTSNNNIFFYDNKIYSYGYHYKLAEIIENNTIIINNTGYSNSTAKHINLITNATRQYNQYFYSDICLNNVYNSIISASKKIITARFKERYANLIISKFESLINFANEFNKVVKQNNYTQDSFLTLIELKKNEQFKEIETIYNEIAKDKDKFIEQGKERERKLKEKKLKEFNESLEKFFNYELNYITLKTDTDYLRISKDKTMIETTQGIKIDIQEAKKLYLMINEGKDIKGVKISNYTVISINGTLKIGCHKINIKNVHEIGQILIKNF